MIILIPTLGRVGKQITYNSLCKPIKKMTRLVVSESEYGAHLALGIPNSRLLVCPMQGRGMAALRSWMIDWCSDNGYKKLLMLDDDLTLQKRRDDLRVLGASTVEQQIEMVDWVEMVLNKFVHCAFTERNAAWADSSTHRIATKGIQCVGYNIPRLVSSGCRFNKDVPDWFFMEDYHMTLQLLESGLPNIVSRVYRVNFGASNAAGGVSRFRNQDSMEEASKLLESLHSKYVTAVLKDTRTSYGGGTRWNVKVMWKKAYTESKTKNPTQKVGSDLAL